MPGPRGGEFAVEAKQGQFAAGCRLRRGAFVVAVEEVFERNLQHVGHPQQIAADLPGAVGLPLRDRRARDAEPGGEPPLGQAAFRPRGAEAFAGGGGRGRGG